MAGDLILPAGTTATYTIGAGTATTANYLKSVGANEATTAMADVTALADTVLKKKPARVDPGTTDFTFFLDNTAVATNQLNTFKSARDNKSKVVFTINLPDPFDDTTTWISYTGYISSISQPEVAAGDEPLTYTVGLQVSGY